MELEKGELVIEEGNNANTAVYKLACIDIQHSTN